MKQIYRNKILLKKESEKNIEKNLQIIKNNSEMRRNIQSGEKSGYSGKNIQRMAKK